MYQWATDLFPICRSLTGEGTRKTLSYLRNHFPAMEIFEVPSGTSAFDWKVPDEWNIHDAYVKDENGNRIIDFQACNLHVLGYSTPIDTVLTFEELDKNIHSLPQQPDAIPYVFSYYQRNWGFCITEKQRAELRKFPNRKYQIKIDSSLVPGNMTYGEIIIPGKSDQEVLFSTYVCHPSMGNNELSGMVVTLNLAKWIQSLPNRQYTYRILFLPETIGSIYYLSQHYKELKEKLKAGYVVTCVGDDRTYSYLSSRKGDTLADRVAKHVLKHHYPDYKSYTFLKDRGSDERQYCSPGIDLPVCSISRSKYNEYPEYHTSLDDLNLISPAGLEGAFDVFKKCVTVLENNTYYQHMVFCEPLLSKRNLYPHISDKTTKNNTRYLTNILAYADGEHDLLMLAEMMDISFFELLPLLLKLEQENLIKRTG